MTGQARSDLRIGVLVPFTNTNLEPDLQWIKPPQSVVYSMRMGGYDVDEIPDSSQMAGLGASDLSESLRLIAGVRPHVVLYGCTSATLTHGSAFDRKLTADIEQVAKCPSVTAAGSLVAALRALGVSNIGFSSPYVGEINAQAVAFLHSEGIETVRCADIGRELGNYGQGELTPDEVFDLALQADTPEAEAIVLSCTDMRSTEIIDRLEGRLGKPVVTSNQAMIFAVMKMLGLPRHELAPGQLFHRLGT